MKRLVICVLVLVLRSNVTFAQQDVFVANTLLPACKAALAVSEDKAAPLPHEMSLLAGICLGVVATTYHLGYFLNASPPTNMRFCIPQSGSTVGQALRIVVKDLEAKPEILHLDLRILTSIILQRAWPCQ